MFPQLCLSASHRVGQVHGHLQFSTSPEAAPLPHGGLTRTRPHPCTKWWTEASARTGSLPDMSVLCYLRSPFLVQRRCSWQECVGRVPYSPDRNKTRAFAKIISILFCLCSQYPSQCLQLPVIISHKHALNFVSIEVVITTLQNDLHNL